MMNIFVSYTMRDGVLSPRVLQRIGALLDPYGSPYIDVLHNCSSDPQARVIKELNEASVLVACITEGFFQSEWVQFELRIATLRAIPIVAIDLRSDLVEHPIFEKKLGLGF